MPTYAVIAARLGDLRRAAGSPSYTEIVRRVGAVRAARGVPDAQQRPGRVTVYDCFKSDRRRFDIELVLDVARALGVDEVAIREWEEQCWSVRHGIDAARVVQVRTELPAPPLRFLGRSAELEQLVAARGVTVVHGMAGAGKTELVHQAARLMLDSALFERVVIADLRGFAPDRPPADPAAVVDAIVRALDSDPLRLPSASDERRRAFTTLLADRRVALVLDDAATAAQVEPVLPLDPTLPVLVTSRHALGEELGTSSLELGPLARSAAVGFLRDASGVSAVWDDHELGELAAAVGDLPLALSVIAARVASRPDWTARDHLTSLVGRHGELRLDDLTTGVLDCSHDALDPETARTLRLVASLPFDDVAVDGVAATVGTDVDTAERQVSDLVAASMASRPEAGRVTLHALVRAHARERSLDADRPAERADALGRMLDHLALMCRSAAAAVSPRPLPPSRAELGEPVEFDAPTALAWADAELVTILSAVGDECRAVRPSIALDLAEAAWWYLDRTSRYHDALMLYDHALAATRSLRDTAGEGLAELGRAQCLTRLADIDQASEAARRAEHLAAGDARTLGRVTNVLAMLAFQTGDWDAAASNLRAAAEHYQTLDAPGSDLARIYDNLGVLNSRLGEFDIAVEYHTMAAEAALGAGDAQVAAHTLMNTSGTHQRRGDHAAALEAAERSIALCEEHGVLSVIALARNNAAAALVELGRHDEAIEQGRRALADAREQGDRYAEAEARVNLGDMLTAAGDLDDAEAELVAARRLCEELDDRFNCGRALHGSGTVARARGDLADARACWEAALDYLDAALPETAAVRDALAELSIDTTP
ncbi:tetratricopeptide repeat protein [Desertimonas flava]|uniref:tetratricopeptide repeat protein n=1 Tax=Desertimonas flava TaxID=2064846 RepID=UPI0013C434C2|nr:tetratricopeptide repeat protein [Desertimonas flava]